ASRATSELRGLFPLAGDGALQLGLVHARAAFDAERFGLLVELLARAPARAGFARAQPAATARRDVCGRRPRARARVAAACARLVDGPRCDLLGAFRRSALFFLGVLDVFVLALALAAFLDATWRHVRHLRRLSVVVCERPTPAMHVQPRAARVRGEPVR